jgi:hypothetical protein
MLYTLEYGEVASKKQAVQWAKDALAPQWQPLLDQVLVDRALGFDPHDPPRPGSVDGTLAFVEYAQQAPPCRGRTMLPT